jgi:aminocarboxymuconate-semialdehyde decarboxylase
MSSASPAAKTIDIHAHILTEETIRMLRSESPKMAPKLSQVDEQFGTLEVAGNVYRQFPRGGWDLDRRLQDMAASKVDVQVLSVCPAYRSAPTSQAGI